MSMFFFVHPTMYFRGDHWNAHLDNDQVNRDTEDAPHASPSKRFQTLEGGCTLQGIGKPTLESSHGKTAQVGPHWNWRMKMCAQHLLHYLEHWNHGRDIILAGHSQGSWHLRWLPSRILRWEATPRTADNSLWSRF